MKILSMSGTCRNGAQRDSGRLYHGVNGNGGWDKAICGAEPGRRGNGWSIHAGKEITCPRCLKKLEKALPADSLEVSIRVRLTQWSTGELGARWYPFTEIYKSLQWEGIPTTETIDQALAELGRAGFLEMSSTHVRYRG